MPRKDRRFTGEDIARLYCRNLSTPEKKLARKLFEDCPTGKKTSDKTLAEIIRIVSEIAESAAVPLVPTALELLADAVETGDTSYIESVIGLAGEPSA